MTDGLRDLLVRRIRADGAISVAEYMALALGHPEHGYYATRDPLGRYGDFVTAPEVSQMFGELIGLWIAVTWRAIGAPTPVTLVELGPGRGTLMADALRAARGMPGFLDAVQVHLVETSPALRAIQAETLAPHNPTWHDDLATLPDGPVLAIANEFLDALPVRQFERTPDGWRERLVGLRPDGSLRVGLATEPSPIAFLSPGFRDDAAPGFIAEVSPQTLSTVATLARRLVARGGAALLIDYGYARPTGRPTFQAIRGHRPVDPLDQPGTADLTAHVDFSAVTRAAAETGAAVHGPIGQGSFLSALGIEARAARLAATAGPDSVRAALARLIDPGEMGTLFKVIAIGCDGDPVPPGFPDPGPSAPGTQTAETGAP